MGLILLNNFEPINTTAAIFLIVNFYFFLPLKHFFDNEHWTRNFLLNSMIT